MLLLTANMLKIFIHKPGLIPPLEAKTMIIRGKLKLESGELSLSTTSKTINLNEATIKRLSVKLPDTGKSRLTQLCRLSLRANVANFVCLASPQHYS